MISSSTQSYIEILEKTNEQLSFWYLPYELGIGFLTLAIAVLTIAFTVILWRQSSDYNKKLKDLLEQKKKQFDDSIKNESAALLSKHLQIVEEKYAMASGETKNLFKGEILEIKKGLNLLLGIKPTLTEPQIQAILGLLNSFGEDQNILVTMDSVLRGREIFIEKESTVKSNLSESQKWAVISLLNSFEAHRLIISNVRNIFQILN